MADIIRFPSERITPKDRDRLAKAALASPFDLEIGTDPDGRPAPYLFRCGEMKPSFLIEKTEDGWAAVDLADAARPVAVLRASSEAQLIRQLSARPPARLQR